MPEQTGPAEEDFPELPPFEQRSCENCLHKNDDRPLDYCFHCDGVSSLWKEAPFHLLLRAKAVIGSLKAQRDKLRKQGQRALSVLTRLARDPYDVRKGLRETIAETKGK